jgi:hypothetical protein
MRAHILAALLGPTCLLRTSPPSAWLSPSGSTPARDGDVHCGVLSLTLNGSIVTGPGAADLKSTAVTTMMT